MNLKVLLLGSLFASSGAFAQTILIDDFITGAGSVGNADDNFESASGYQTGSMIGGSRAEQLLCYYGCDDSYSTMTIGSGALSVTGPPGGHNTAEITWGSNSSPLNVDFSSESGLLLKFSAVSGPLEIESYLISGSGYSTYGTSASSPGSAIGAGSNQTVFLPFSSFYGSATLSSVSEVELILGGGSYGVGDGASMASYSLTYVAAVPEPSDAALLASGLGAVAFFVCRRRFAPRSLPAAQA
jgi:hypothetical protein